jgi:hypothetical protein
VIAKVLQELPRIWKRLQSDSVEDTVVAISIVLALLVGYMLKRRDE